MHPLTRKFVPDADRLGTIARLFGAAFPLHIEPMVYASTASMAPEYRGGYWDFQLLSNGAFYMSLDVDWQFAVSCSGNNYRGTLSGDALGIVACLYTYSHLSFSQEQQLGRLCAQHYHWLRAWAVQHKEAMEIFQAID